MIRGGLAIEFTHEDLEAGRVTVNDLSLELNR